MNCGLLPIEEQRGLRRVAIACVGAVAVALEEAERDQRVEEVGVRARVQPERCLQLARRSSPWRRAR